MNIFMERMKKTIAVFLAVAIILCITPAEAAYGTVAEKATVPYDSESLLVKLRADRMTLYSSRNQFDCLEKLEYLFSNHDVSLYSMSNSSDEKSGEWYVARLAEGVSPEEAAKELLKSDYVLDVEFNYYIELFGDVGTSDPLVKNQWYLQRCGVPEARQYLADNFNAPGGRSDIVVAVLDTGVKYDHRDLANNIWTNIGEIPNNGIDDDGNGYTDDIRGWDFVDSDNDPYDTNGHGTFCSGIIAGVRNGSGIEGVAFGVKIMPVKVSNTENVIAGIKYACDNGADIINMSWGLPNSKSLREIIEKYAYADDVIFVAAAGNDGYSTVPVNGWYQSSVVYPAAYPQVIGVMSSDENPSTDEGYEGDMKSGFSNWDPIPGDGADYELIAPGDNMFSTLVDSKNPSTNAYGTGSGTSFSAPFVSGCFALLLTKYKGREDFSINDLKQMVIDTGDKIQGVTSWYFDAETYKEKKDVYYFNSINIANALNYRREAAILYNRCYLSDGQPRSIEPDVVYGEAASNIQFTYIAASRAAGAGLPSDDGQYIVTAVLPGKESLYYEIVNPQVTLTLTSTVGDYNGDNIVDGSDLSGFSYFMYAYEMNDGRYCELADLNGDGVIDTKDLILLSRKITVSR